MKKEIEKIQKLDWRKIQRQFLLYTAAPLIVFLTALQNGMGVKAALLALYGAFINVVINFLIKYQQADGK